MVTLLFPYTKIYKQYPNFAKHGDWARVTRYIEQNEKPNQAIIVLQTFNALSPPYYYKGANPTLPEEARRPLENFVREHYTVVETQDFYLERLRFLRKK